MNYLLILFFLLGFALIYLIAEFSKKVFNPHPEISRKTGHILSGILIFSSSFFLNKAEILIFLFVTFLGALFSRISKEKKWKIFAPKSIYSVERKSFGTPLFPLAFLLIVFFTNYNLDAFRFGVLILTIPDALASIFGSIYGKKITIKNFDEKLQKFLPKNLEKSFLGSSIFFIFTFFLALFFSGFFQTFSLQSFFISFIASAILTDVEFFTTYGLDNLFLPILGAGFLIYFF